MAVYVDPLRNTGFPQNGDWPFCQSCHLVADEKQELQDFARRMHLKDIWMHYSVRYRVPHYDLTASMRRRAVAQGAVEISFRQMGYFLKAYKSA